MKNTPAIIATSLPKCFLKSSEKKINEIKEKLKGSNLRERYESPNKTKKRAVRISTTRLPPSYGITRRSKSGIEWFPNKIFLQMCQCIMNQDVQVVLVWIKSRTLLSGKVI